MILYRIWLYSAEKFNRHIRLMRWCHSKLMSDIMFYNRRQLNSQHSYTRARIAIDMNLNNFESLLQFIINIFMVQQTIDGRMRWIVTIENIFSTLFNHVQWEKVVFNSGGFIRIVWMIHECVKFAIESHSHDNS